MREARRTVERLPATVTARLRRAASQTATRIQGGARARLRAQTRGTGRTADAISVREDADGKAFAVESKAVRPAPANLPGWLEYGTSKMAARPYMRPAAEAERARYRREIQTAAEQAAHEAGL